MKRLIVHVGPGKTGSTAIQHTLRRSRSELSAENIAYWGHSLNLAPIQAYSWQGMSQGQLLKEMMQRKDLPAEFADCVARSFSTGPQQAIVSNETFGGQERWCIPLLRAVEHAGIDILVIAYVRSPLAKIQSAYSEGHLRRKTHPGRIRSFAEVGYRQRVAAPLEAFVHAFGDSVEVRNYDAVGDVVVDFMSAVGIDVKLPHILANVRPGPEAELIRAFYNDRQKGTVAPAEFRSFANPKHVDLEFDVLSWYRGLLPKEEDIVSAAHAMVDETKRLNALLAQRGQPLLSDRAELAIRPEISTDRLVGVLLQIVYSQHLRLSALEEENQLLIRSAKVGDKGRNRSVDDVTGP
ncbi:MAG: hypothetical protein J4F40_20200 [Alphaproteobacteria bacterium]|nr:hypothetical protein [Alphaproteobacteria bacterium]